MEHYNTVYVGMDVHKENFSLCCYTRDSEKAVHTQNITADYRLVLKYLDAMRRVYGEDTEFICGYEAGCLGYTLYRDLTAHDVNCKILAPSTMPSVPGKKRIKTDKRDAENIAKCLANRTYSPVHIPTREDEEIKEFIRMRDDHNRALKRTKQQLLAFCLRQGLLYDGGDNWTQKHLHWLRMLNLKGVYQEILDEYILTYDKLKEAVDRLDRRIVELAEDKRYQEPVHKLRCFLGIETHTALSLIVEISDFNRFASAEKFASFLGLVPGEHTSSNSQNRLGITKAGNSHLRRLLTEAAHCFGRGKVGYKSEKLKKRQAGNPPAVIQYADRANERLRRKFYKMVFAGKKRNVAATAVARELACFVWGMMTDHIEPTA